MGKAGLLHRGDEAIGAALDRVFAPVANPWRHLGALAFLCLVACAATGAWLWAVFDTSVDGAYASGRALEGYVAGRLVRGMHRYSADAFAFFTLAHLAREAARGHFRHWRAWSWLSGAALLPLAWVAGVTGLWLAWDERALFSAAATAEWLAAAPWRLAAFARNFATPGATTDRFFSLVAFVHIGVPLLALAATWAHLQRLAHVRAWPPRALGIALVASLAVLALVLPATSLGRADPLAEPATVSIDWFYLAPHALAAAITPSGLWMVAAAAAAVLVAMPWVTRAPRPAAAVVDLAHCNGCARCAADCPFAAVIMVPRSDGRPHPREAHVIPELCAACGICAGACPSATPFRRRATPASGIELPFAPIAALHAALDAHLAGSPGEPVVFGCARAAQPGAIALECAAMLPPAFVQYALRGGAHGVVLATCREGDCEYRLGDRWTRERIAGDRAPRLRATVTREAVSVVPCGTDRRALARAVAQLRIPEVSR